MAGANVTNDMSKGKSLKEPAAKIFSEVFGEQSGSVKRNCREKRHFLNLTDDTVFIREADGECAKSEFDLFSVLATL